MFRKSQISNLSGETVSKLLLFCVDAFKNESMDASIRLRKETDSVDAFIKNNNAAGTAIGEIVLDLLINAPEKSPHWRNNLLKFTCCSLQITKYSSK